MRTGRLAAGCAALALAGISSAGVAAPTVWEGSARISTAAAACSGTISAGDFFVSIFRPKFSAGDPPAGITFISTRSAALYYLEGTKMPVPPSGTYDAQGVGSHATFFNSGGAFSGGFSITVTPSTATLTATTPFIRVTGKLANFTNITGCTVTFAASYELRTD